jgi:WD40 repeat protein
VLARSPDGALSVERSEEGTGGWIFASAAVNRTRDKTRAALLPHEWQLRYALFTRDSRYLVTVTARASMDAADPSATALVGSTVRVWDAKSWLKVTEVSLAHEGGIESAAATADGEWLATSVAGAERQTVLLWPLRPELARAEACRRLGRNLSPSEWLSFVNDGPPRATCPGLPIESE